MTIIEALKDENNLNLRLSIGNKCMFYDISSQQWIVASKKYRGQTNIIIYEGTDEEEAVKLLLQDK